MTANECLAQAKAAGETYQRFINAFIDEFRRASAEDRASLVADPVQSSGALEALIAAVVSALCRETGTPTPEWVAHVGSP